MKENFLKVQYKKQIHEVACGAAVLEMVYIYNGLNNVSQEDIFNSCKELNPDLSDGSYYIPTLKLLEHAKSVGFSNSFMGQLDYTDKKAILNILNDFIMQGFPIIVSQRFKENEGSHFRLVTGFSKNKFHLHDPYYNSKIWSVNKFKKFWQPLGIGVTGGIFVIIKK